MRHSRGRPTAREVDSGEVEVHRMAVQETKEEKSPASTTIKDELD